MQNILLKNVNEANKSPGNSTECEMKRLEREKGGNEKKREELWTENGSASHLGWARGLVNYLIAYPPNLSPLHPVVSLLH